MRKKSGGEPGGIQITNLFGQTVFRWNVFWNSKMLEQNHPASLKMGFNLRNWVGWWFDVQSSAWKVCSTWSQDIPGLCTLDVRSASSFVIETASSYPSLGSFGTSKRPHNKHKHGQSGESLHLFQSGNSCNLPRSIVFVWKYKSKTHAHYFFLRAITSGASQQPQCGNTGNHSETQKR